MKLQPVTSDFLDISNPKAVLERTLRSYTCLTVRGEAVDAFAVQGTPSGSRSHTKRHGVKLSTGRRLFRGQL